MNASRWSGASGGAPIRDKAEPDMVDRPPSIHATVRWRQGGGNCLQRGVAFVGREAV